MATRYKVRDRVKVGGWYGTIVEVQETTLVQSHRTGKLNRRRRRRYRPFCVEFDHGGRDWYTKGDLTLVSSVYDRARDKFDQADLSGHPLMTKAARHHSQNKRERRHVQQ